MIFLSDAGEKRARVLYIHTNIFSQGGKLINMHGILIILIIIMTIAMLTMGEENVVGKLNGISSH